MGPEPSKVTPPKTAEQITNILHRMLTGAYSLEAAQYDVVAEYTGRDGLTTVITAAVDYQAAKARFAALNELWRAVTGEEFQP